jgi:hypothetical protein
MWTNNSGDRAIACYPNKEQKQSFIRSLKHIFMKSQNLDAYNLIAKLNPIIRGWSAYFNIGNSSLYRDHVRQALYKLCWDWAQNKHRRWGKKAISDYYFFFNKEKFLKTSLDPNVKLNESLPNIILFKNIKWVFHG